MNSIKITLHFKHIRGFPELQRCCSLKWKLLSFRCWFPQSAHSAHSRHFWGQIIFQLPAQLPFLSQDPLRRFIDILGMQTFSVLRNSRTKMMTRGKLGLIAYFSPSSTSMPSYRNLISRCWRLFISPPISCCAYTSGWRWLGPTSTQSINKVDWADQISTVSDASGCERLQILYCVAAWVS